jgi:L-proline amide hydrolase
MQWQGMQTWYRVVGERHRDQNRAPLLICHGGPGLTHDYLTSVAELSRSGRACVLYDQFGSGRSGRRPGASADFWTVDLYLRELESLVEHLGIADGYHVLGHSWGGMLALELALRHPPGLRSLVVADAFASSNVYSEEVSRLLKDLPSDVRTTIERHEAGELTDEAAYQQAVGVFYRKHVFRRSPVPDDLMRTMVALNEDSTVYRTMAGPSEFQLTGTLRDWDIRARLGSVDVPVLIISGRYDEVTPRAVEPLQQGLSDARWVLFDESSHMPHLEEHDRFIDEVEKFLAQDVRG